ncbi:MAG: hypothetical protein ACK4ZJ_19735, partial [Allorhizobium sp.]
MGGRGRRLRLLRSAAPITAAAAAAAAAAAIAALASIRFHARTPHTHGRDANGAQQLLPRALCLGWQRARVQLSQLAGQLCSARIVTLQAHPLLDAAGCQLRVQQGAQRT